MTIVLVGSQTAGRKYVDYEIVQSYKQGKGMIGIYIHGIKNEDQRTDMQGKNPFEKWHVDIDGQRKYFSNMYPTYDWIKNDSYNNMPKWIEIVAKLAGK